MDLLKCGYTLDDIETARPEDMERYYAPEQIRKYGALGIELRLLHGYLISQVQRSLFSARERF